MRRRFSFISFLLGLALSATADAADDVRSLAVIDPLALRALDARIPGGLGLVQMLDPAGRGVVTNDALFALSSMQPVRAALDIEFGRYVAPPGAQLFDRSLLTSADTRFVLAGIVNRMDRAFVAPDTCGEIRLIYRLQRSGRMATLPRLPMTLNLVLRARQPEDLSLSCAEIARRWMAMTELIETGEPLASRLLAVDGALASITPAHIDRIESNLQIAHVPKSDTQAFRTDYLQKVFRYDVTTGLFREAPLENQIDRDRLLADASLGRDFKRWLLRSENLRAFDRGTLLVPEKFLATSSLTSTPVGFARSRLQPAFGLMQSDGTGQAVFNDSDVVAALERAAANGVTLQNIRSPAGFARRLNDITCGGCHQVRGIGGFHFPGVDVLAEKPSNNATVPMSPHFVGDQPRRRDIVTAIRDGKAPDFSRGFSDRPQSRRSMELAGSEYLDGWGATCSLPDAKRGKTDVSFASWNCAKGLACQPVGDVRSVIGMCFVK